MATIYRDTTDIVYDYIKSYLERNNGRSPSQREIARGCYLAQSSVRYHLAKLIGQGRITYGQGQVRAITLLDQ